MNVLVRPLARSIDRQPAEALEDDVAYRRRVACRADNEAHIRALRLQATGGGQFLLQSLHSEDVDGTERVRVRADLLSPDGRNDGQLEQAASRLSLERHVAGVSWEILEGRAYLDDDR